MPTTPDFGIPELAPAQANPDVTHNEALIRFQAILNGAIDKDRTSPPSSPTEGDTYLINTATPTGAWAGRGYCIAIWYGGVWRFTPDNDDSGTPIAMGARQEGLTIYVRDEDRRYTWRGLGSPAVFAWSGTLVTAAEVSNTPAGNIAATNLQTAINELDGEKAGLALANTFTAEQTINTTTIFPFNVTRTTASTVGAFMRTTLAKTTPGAVNDIMMGWQMFGMNASSAQFTAIDHRAIVTVATASAERAQLTWGTINGGTLLFSGGLTANGVTGGDEGVGTANFTTLYEAGVSLASKYAALAGAAFTGAVSVGVAGLSLSLGVLDPTNGAATKRIEFLAGGYGNPAAFNTASNGDKLILYRNVTGAYDASMGVGSGSNFWFKSCDAAGSGVSNFEWYGGNAPSLIMKLRNGLSIGANAATDYGFGAMNADGFFITGTVVIDSNRLLRSRNYTVATLPSASGVTGAIAYVTDANATTRLSVAAGGGSNKLLVQSDGTNWLIV